MLFALCGARASDDFPIGTPHLFYLENGLEVLLVENHSSPMIAATAVIRVGSGDETPDLNGATHFLEHLLFDGTETRTQQDIEDAFERLGGYNNAQTSNDHTAFMILAEKEKFGQAIELQADMLFFSMLAPEQITKEKGIVTEEIGQSISNDPRYLAALAFDRLRWEGTPYAYPVLGTRESIEAMERDRLWAFYKQHYVPDNMGLLIMGDFEPQEMMRLVEASYGKARPGALVSRQREKPKLAPSWEPLELVTDAGTYLWLAFPWESIRGGWNLEPVEILLPGVLDVVVGEPLREQFKGDILSLSWSWDMTRSGVQLLLQMEISPAAPPEALLNSLRARLVSLDPTSASLSLWRAKAHAAMDDEIDQSQRFHFFGMLHAGQIARDGCRGLPKGMREMVEFRDRLEAARVGSPGIMKTVSEAVPFAVLFRPAGKAVDTTERLRHETDTTLANGLRLLIRSEPSMPVFAAHFLFQGRSSTEGPQRMGWVDMLHRLLEYGIPSRMGKTELRQKLDSLRLRWKLVDDPSIPFDDYYTQPDFSFIRLSGPTASQKEGLQLVFELLKKDEITQDDLAAVRNEMLNLIQISERSPRNQADMAFRQTLLGVHPLASPVLGTVASISAADLSALKQLRQAYFRPNRLILSIVTSETVEATAAMVESIFGVWESGSSLLEIPQPSMPLDSLVRLKIGARQAQIRFGALLPNLSGTQRQEMEIWTALLSDNLQNDLRETRGLAYSVGAELVWQRGWGWLALRMGTRAENVPSSLEAMKEWVKKLQAEPLEKSQLEKVYASWRGTQLIRRMARDQQAFQLGWAAMKGEEPFAPLPEASLDPAAIARTAREMLAKSQWIQIIVE
ncbi:MAG: insulinase family protein [bacterium]